jgi:hypothetical protein
LSPPQPGAEDSDDEDATADTHVVANTGETLGVVPTARNTPGATLPKDGYGVKKDLEDFLRARGLHTTGNFDALAKLVKSMVVIAKRPGHKEVIRGKGKQKSDVDSMGEAEYMAKKSVWCVRQEVHKMALPAQGEFITSSLMSKR